MGAWQGEEPMSDEMTPSGAGQSPEPAMPAPAGPSGTDTGAEAVPGAGSATSAGAMIPSDTTSRMIITAGLATAILALVGGLIGAWRMDYMGLVLIVAGLAAAGVAWAGATGIVRIDALPGRDIELASGIVAGVLAVLNLFEMLFDLDQLDERGETLGAVLTVALAVTSAGPLRRCRATLDEPTRGSRERRSWHPARVCRRRPRHPRLARQRDHRRLEFLGRGGGPDLRILLAGIVLRWASDPASKRLPIAGAWLAVVLAAIAAVLGVNHLTGFLDRADDFGALDWLLLLLYLAGVVLTLVGSVWTAYERTMDAQERSNIGTGDVS